MSSRAKARNKRIGINARRKGQAAIGGGSSKPFPTFRVLYPVKIRKPKREPFNEPLTVAEAYGNAAPVGGMTQERIRWAAWEKRKDAQREIAKKQTAENQRKAYEQMLEMRKMVAKLTAKLTAKVKKLDVSA
jgi:hypothetical protein